ncbi:protein LTO1 homolog isoform 2-T2 [Polymixia lowei]
MTGSVWRGTGTGLNRGPSEACRTDGNTARRTEPDCPLRFLSIMGSLLPGNVSSKIRRMPNQVLCFLRKRVKALETLMGMIQKSPHDDAEYSNIVEDMEKVRAKFRQVCSLLGVPTDFRDYVKVASGVSF